MLEDVPLGAPRLPNPGARHMSELGFFPLRGVYLELLLLEFNHFSEPVSEKACAGAMHNQQTILPVFIGEP